MKETFVKIRFKSKFAALLKPVQSVFNQYQQLGYDLTVRQLYYQLVARNIIENTQKNYKMIIGLVTDARLGGFLDWGTLVDRGRGAKRNPTWLDPKTFLAEVVEDFELDKWAVQPNYIEIMVEKDALSGVVGPVAAELGIAYTANKGYSSSTSFYRAGKRFRRQAMDHGRICHLIYLGDHDPSGIDMTRDVEERVSMLGGSSYETTITGRPHSLPIQMHRVALNWDQIQELNPPENFAKEADSRTPKYINQFGESCYELDAVEPQALAEMIRAKVISLRDNALWDRELLREAEMIKRLRAVAKRFKK